VLTGGPAGLGFNKCDKDMIASDKGPRALPCSNIPPELEHRIPEILESCNFKDSW
jgi:hypothetical protein